ncbi:hypothetical protein BDC45DRAFT_605751 [Circinella umbellata]|nr:hypothetical protein BDC45DRAFT_605751 [Circinella umbellata]
MQTRHFWTRVIWNAWSITGYDKVATKNIIGLNKNRAHEFLQQDLTEVFESAATTPIIYNSGACSLLIIPLVTRKEHFENETIARAADVLNKNGKRQRSQITSSSETVGNSSASYTGKQCDIPQDAINRILDSGGADEEHLIGHHYSQCNNGHLMAPTNQICCEVAHKHNKEFMKQVIPKRRYNDLGSKQVEVRELAVRVLTF